MSSNPPLPAETGPALTGESFDLPGVTASYHPDIRLAAPETDLAVTAVAMHYERTRIGGRTGQPFFRCLRCRALIEERLKEQDLHAQWHEKVGDPLAPVDDIPSGWGTST